MRFRRPITNENGNVQFDYSTEVGTRVGGVITLESIPEVQAGTYYFAVGNCSSVPVSYSIAAKYGGGSTSASPLTTILSSGITANGSIPAGPFLNSRQFVIQVPSTATGLTVRLQGSTDVDLFVRNGQPISLGAQGLPVADGYAETESSSESLTFTRLTQPDLRPGLYYIGIYNFDSNATAKFSVTATITTAAPEPTRVVPLDSGSTVPVNMAAGSAGLGNLGATQYSVQVPRGATKLTVSANTNLDAKIYIRRNTAVSVQEGRPLFDHFFRPSSFQSRLDISQESSPALQAGTYFIALANFSPSPGIAALTATVETSLVNVPQISAGGVVNAASFRATSASPGSLVSIFGSGFASTQTSATTLPLPREIGGVSVTFNGVRGALFFVAPSQINAQIPFEVLGASASVVVSSGGVSSAPVFVPLSTASPGILTQNSSGSGPGIVVNASTGSLITASAPIQRGQFATIYGVGFGPLAPQASTGIPASANPLSNTVVSPSISVAGIPANVLFSGLAPGFIGLNQINIQIPETAPVGTVSLAATVNGVTSNTVTVAIQ